MAFQVFGKQMIVKAEISLIDLWEIRSRLMGVWQTDKSESRNRLARSLGDKKSPSGCLDPPTQQTTLATHPWPKYIFETFEENWIRQGKDDLDKFEDVLFKYPNNGHPILMYPDNLDLILRYPNNGDPFQKSLISQNGKPVSNPPVKATAGQ